MVDMDIEAALRQIQARAALLRYAANCGSGHPEIPDAAVFLGIGDACEQIERLAGQIRDVLDVHALGLEIGEQRSRRR